MAVDRQSCTRRARRSSSAASEVETGETYEIRSPYDGAPVALVHRAGPAEVERAIAGAVEAFETTRHLPSWRREEILRGGSRRGIAARREELARTIALEAGKPIKIARVEVDRAVFTFTIAAEESKRIYGEIVPLDWLPGNEGRIAQVRRVPLGPIAGISPFNFPLNLVAHKVAPALAAGNPIVLRPASQTPVSSLMLGRDRARGRLARGRDRRRCPARPRRRGRSSRTTGSSCSRSPAARSSAGA